MRLLPCDHAEGVGRRDRSGRRRRGRTETDDWLWPPLEVTAQEATSVTAVTHQEVLLTSCFVQGKNQPLFPLPPSRKDERHPR